MSHFDSLEAGQLLDSYRIEEARGAQRYGVYLSEPSTRAITARWP